MIKNSASNTGLIDIVIQNRITRKKLKKAIKRQAANRLHAENKRKAEIRLVCDIHKACEATAEEILNVVNFGEFDKNSTVSFDAGFLRMTFSNGMYSVNRINIPTKQDLED